VGKGHPCYNVNCGEGGCIAKNGTPVCVCPNSMKPPDEGLLCHRTIYRPIGGQIGQLELPKLSGQLLTNTLSDFESEVSTILLQQLLFYIWLNMKFILFPHYN